MEPFLALVLCLWKEIIYFLLSENLKFVRHSGITIIVCTPATTYAFRGASFCLGRPENLALHQHNQNKRKETWIVLYEVLQWFWKSQTATSHVPIPNKIQEPILMLVNTSFLVSKSLYSWLFLLGSHRYYSELFWKEQHLSQKNSLFNIYSCQGWKKQSLHCLPGTKAGKFECKQEQLSSANDCNCFLHSSASHRSFRHMMRESKRLQKL